MKILVIDTIDNRRKSITARLRSRGWIVSSMYMISIDNLQSILSSYDILVILDQEEVIVKTILSKIADKSIKCIFNQRLSSLMPFTESENHIFINANESNDMEESVVSRIEKWLLKETTQPPISYDARTKAMLDVAKKAAKTNATVLITGETGTGKEVLAKYIHQNSKLSNGPFVAVNCAALPENMMESVLFGYEKGAFTSAVNAYVGKFEQAQNGTLFLDEISEMSVGLQAKLLRVLQEKEMERLSGKKLIRLSLRVIAASNRDLKQLVRNGGFRKDLYYRLHVISIQCPPLKDREHDILPLAQFYISHYSRMMERIEPSLTESAKHRLLRYRWPGNIRELDNVIQRAMIMTDGQIIDENNIDLEGDIYDLDHTVDRAERESNIELFTSRLEETEAMAIMEVLHESDGCRNVAARKLNISPRTLRYKIAKLRAIGIKVP